MAAAMTAKSAADRIVNHTAPSYNFRFSDFLRQTYQVGLSPDRPICQAFQTGHCPNGTRCTERHVLADGPNDDAPGGGGGGKHQQGGLNSLVCKHWLRGLCKKGEHCEFLHEYNLRKMPECNFFMRNGYCSNGDECLYLHIDPLSRLPPCPHYDMGFCPLGPTCSKKHVRRKLCAFYLAGFCPDGPACRAGSHPKWSKDLERPTVRGEDKEDSVDGTVASGAPGGREDGEGASDRQRDGGFQRDEGGGGRFGGGRHEGRGRGGRGGWRGGGGRGRYRSRGH